MKDADSGIAKVGIISACLCLIAGLFCGSFAGSGWKIASIMFFAFVLLQLMCWLYLPFGVMFLRPPRMEFVVLFFISLLGIPITWLQAGFYLDLSGPRLNIVAIKSHYR